MLLKSKTKFLFLCAIALCGLVLLAFGLSHFKKSTSSEPVKSALGAQVSEEGSRITFELGYPGLEQFKILEVKQEKTSLSIKAPAQIVASFQAESILFAQPDISNLYSQYLQSVANHERLHKNEGRAQEMFRTQAATERDLNDAKTESLNAKAVLVDLEMRLKAAGLDPLELKRQAPGVVWLLADVPENQLSEVEKGELVKVSFLSFNGQVFSGHVSSIGDVIDPNIRTVKVRVVLSNDQNRLRPGMFAECDFGAPQTSAVVVPASALVSVEEKNFVFVQSDQGRFERREVSIANSNDNFSAIASGLKTGEQVVVSGVMLLKGLSFGY